MNPTTKNESKPVIILLVEDNPAHAELVIRGFKDFEIPTDIKHLSDGEQALDYLFRRGFYASDKSKSPRPNVILLDLGLPKVNGLEILKKVKTNDKLHAIPVIVLTTVDAPKDVVQAYTYRANSFLVKPISYKKFAELMHSIGDYWLRWNRKPDILDE